MNTRNVIAGKVEGLNRWLTIKRGHTAFSRFLVLTRSRSGSSMLMSFFRSHPQVEVYGEYFSRLGQRSYQEMLAEVFSPHPRKIKAVGFKLFYNHPFDDPDSELWAALSAMKDLRVVHLTRVNFLRTYVSRRIAEEQSVWSIRGAKEKSELKAPVLVIKPQELWSAYEKTRQMQEDRVSILQNQRMIDLTYEGLVEQPVAEFGKITHFLEIDDIAPQTNLRKQNTRKLSEIITNYAELKEGLVGTELESFLEE